MIKIQENKNNFFSLRLNLSEESREIRDLIDDAMDKVLKILDSGNQCYSFFSKTGLSVSYFFRTGERKRPLQVRKVLDKNLPMSVITDYQLVPNTKTNFLSSRKTFEISPVWLNARTPKDNSDYDARDIAIFKDRSNWHHWQTSLYNKLFDEYDQIREPDDRTLIVIWDHKGLHGKSKFAKWMVTENLESTVKLSYGNSTQLRNSVVEGGAREIFFIDCPRAKGKNDSMIELLSVIEDIKNGFVTTPMYGKGKNNVLLQNPPFVVIFTNDHLPYSKLTQDR